MFLINSNGIIRKFNSTNIRIAVFMISNQRITLPNLKKGDTVAIVAPAGRVDREKVEAALTMLHKWNFDVELGQNLFQQYYNFAGNDQQRASDLQTMMDNPKVKAILCARGGYGTLRILDQLDFTTFQQHPKWLIGFSDITVLHAHLNNVLQIPSIHGAMTGAFLNSPASVESLRRIIFGDPINYHLPSLSTLNRNGSGEGILIGGNISLLYALNGSPEEIKTEGKILFLEEIGEYLYHLDRMLWQFKRAGKLSKLAGLIIGGLTDMKDNPIPFGLSAQEIIYEHIKEYDYPVCFDFPTGHDNNNQALILGTRVSLQVNANSISLFT